MFYGSVDGDDTTSCPFLENKQTAKREPKAAGNDRKRSHSSTKKPAALNLKPKAWTYFGLNTLSLKKEKRVAVY